LEKAGWNDALRFLLELIALAGWGMLGHSLGRGAARWVFAVVMPVAVATVWAVFRVPNDPGPAPVEVTGQVRILIEAAVFGGAVYGISRQLGAGPAVGFLAVTLLHYALAWERLVRLAKRDG
jgi:hypothetical protein